MIKLAQTQAPVQTDSAPSPVAFTETAVVTEEVTGAAAETPAAQSTQVEDWQAQFAEISWVAYSPPSADPNKGIQASPDAIAADLAVLREAGFTGLVTYSSAGVLGQDLPGIAQAAGFQGLIMGIWDPKSEAELDNARAAASMEVLFGYCVGNEGLGARYQLNELAQAVETLRQDTGKPVSTTEEIDDYSDANLLNLGDWVFPNAHPYFHSQIAPDNAVRWTRAAYEDLSRRAGRLVVFKEVGLPTAGNAAADLSEANQDAYYTALQETNVRFVYFEGFDQPWKTTLPIEPHWGLFTSDRNPKMFAQRLMSKTTLTPTANQDIFYVYKDLNFSGNHFSPSGFMGDIGDITIDEGDTSRPYSGETAIKVTYAAKGTGPNECEGWHPCKWAGVYWLEPPNNWGTDEFLQDSGFDLSGYRRLVFWARAEKETAIEFKVGGVINPYGDSLEFPRSTLALLTPEWQRCEIDLDDADLSYIIGGFVWVSNWVANFGGITFYIDEIYFEK